MVTNDELRTHITRLWLVVQNAHLLRVLTEIDPALSRLNAELMQREATGTCRGYLG